MTLGAGMNIIDQREQEVFRHNDMIQKSRFQLSVQEQKVIQFLISKVKPTDKKFHVYEFDIFEFCKVCGISINGKNYKNLKNTIKSLADKSMWVKDYTGRETLLRWINKAVIDPNVGVIEVKLDDDLMPYLLQLKNNYTSYALKYILAMDSQYSIRLYEILRSLEYRNCKHTFEVEHLKRLLDAENYARYPDFKRWVLDAAMREINELSDIAVDYLPIKEGRKTAKIEFTVKLKKDIGERLEAWGKIEKKLGNSIT
jgi:plasmid replication initiation protein